MIPFFFVKDLKSFLTTHVGVTRELSQALAKSVLNLSLGSATAVLCSG